MELPQIPCGQADLETSFYREHTGAQKYHFYRGNTWASCCRVITIENGNREIAIENGNKGVAIFFYRARTWQSRTRGVTIDNVTTQGHSLHKEILHRLSPITSHKGFNPTRKKIPSLIPLATHKIIFPRLISPQFKNSQAYNLRSRNVKCLI